MKKILFYLSLSVLLVLLACSSEELYASDDDEVKIVSVNLIDEVVIIQNVGSKTLDLTGWELVSVNGNQSFVFPSVKISPRDTIKIVSGRNLVDYNSIKWTGKYIWNNGGDQARLYNGRGELISAFPDNTFSRENDDFSNYANYYADAIGKRGQELKEALHEIIDDHKEYSYKELWNILIETDEDPQNKNNFILLYTGRSIPKSSRYPEWSREHVWSKSHGDFGNDRGAGTDLHHLRPADVSVNSSRSNKDFDNGGKRHQEARECFSDSDSWEARDRVKGDIARMMLYMAVRYEGDDGELDLELVDRVDTVGPVFGKLSTLLGWHREDPVDDFERRRNNVIYEYQGNRNPFVDNPEWVEMIWN